VSYAILTHGGAASPHRYSDGCVAAAERARSVLDRGGDALAAALEATLALEDDPRFNAGTGSNLRLDGRLIEMDASVMTSDGRFGGVACIQAVKNPVLVAARVMETPHLILAGEGATAFARRMGFAAYDPTTEGAKNKYARAVAELRGRGDGDFADDAAPWKKAKPAAFWNFEGEPLDCDTVGAVVRDVHGRFAATASTGGTVYMLRGRVGDSPLMGAGVYAGPHGAVAATGVGEEIVRRFLSKTVYDWLAEDVPPVRAAQRAIAMFPDVVDIGLLVVGKSGQAVVSNRNMASATLLPAP
jgi:isoaspartyl peptidase/L-asparaginase-like protein (Ntn-hydrolase superfamily)